MNDWKRNETFENIFRRGRHAESTGCRFFGGHLHSGTLHGIVPGETLVWCRRLRAILLVQAAKFGAGWNNPGDSKK